MPSVTFGLCWWYNHTDDVVPPSTALAFVTKMSEKCKSTSPSAVQVKIYESQYWREIRHIKPTWKCERIVDICRNVRYAHISVHTIHDNADWITESAKLRAKVFV